MRVIFRYSLVILVAAVVFLGTATSAQAGFKLRVDVSSTGPVDVESSDLDLDGLLLFTGPVGFFTTNTVTGLSKPTIGSPAAPQLDLNSVNVSSGSNRIIDLWLTDTGFTGVGQAVARIGGTTSGSVTYEAFWDPGNGEFATTNPIGSSMSFGPGPVAFSNTGSSNIVTGGVYSLTQHIRITHSGTARTTSFNAEILVPEPVTMAMLGLGLAALAVVSRRKSSRAE